MIQVMTLADANKSLVWSRWRAGRPMIEIAKEVGLAPTSVFSFLRYHGGIQPHGRCRRSSSLMLPEREEISRGVAAGMSLRSIAFRLGRASSTMSREIQRNGGLIRYRATDAERAAWRRARRRKPFVLRENQTLREMVISKLCADWSPEQISGCLAVTYPDQPRLRSIA